MTILILKKIIWRKSSKLVVVSWVKLIYKRKFICYIFLYINITIYFKFINIACYVRWSELQKI